VTATTEDALRAEIAELSAKYRAIRAALNGVAGHAGVYVSAEDTPNDIARDCCNVYDVLSVAGHILIQAAIVDGDIRDCRRDLAMTDPCEWAAAGDHGAYFLGTQPCYCLDNAAVWCPACTAARPCIGRLRALKALRGQNGRDVLHAGRKMAEAHRTHKVSS